MKEQIFVFFVGIVIASTLTYWIMSSPPHPQTLAQVYEECVRDTSNSNMTVEEQISVMSACLQVASSTQSR